MVLTKIAAASLALAAGISAFPTFGFSSASSPSTKVFESIDAAPAGWVKHDGAINKDQEMVELHIQLVHQNMDKFHETAMNIATPGHSMYGKHLSQNVIDEMIAPKDESKDLVLEWLRSNGLASSASISPRKNTVTLETSIAKLEKLLETEYNTYNHQESGEMLIRTLKYSLPKNLDGHVSMVQPTTFFGLRSMKSGIKTVLPVEDLEAATGIEAVTGCSGTVITPTCLSNLYSFAGTPSQSNGRMGIAGFLEQYPSQSDLKTFMSRFAISTFGNAAQTYTCTSVNSGSCTANPASPGVEANLDVQYARAITKDIPNVYYSTAGRPPLNGGGTNTNEPYLQFLNYILGLSDANLPNTLSISYGDDEATVPLSYADQCCTLFAQLGARGVSVMVASGDSGVGTTCKVNGNTQYTTAFPASCPWVTTVGGTTSNSPERTWTSGGSGFSEVFGRPSYQDAAVTGWLASNSDGKTQYYNNSGRAYPDVAAQATNYEIVVSGTTEGVSGTSCASPAFASVIQLLNSGRLAAGKAPLGFLNPWLYGNATSGFTDITTGKNTGCTGVISGAGFTAIKGWDPATGLGTPNYKSLLAISNAT